MAPFPIAVVMTSFDPGGTERQMIELIRRLDPSRWQIHLACFVGRGAWFHKAAEVAASVVEFPVTSFRNPSTFKHVWAFSRWCRAKRIAVVHTTEFYSNTFGLPGAALAGVPARIGSRRGLNPDKSRAQIALQRAAYACAHTIVANSRAAAPSRAASAGSFISRPIRSASARASPVAASSPVRPSSMSSRIPPTADATIGRPAAIASITAFGSASERDGSTKMSASASRSATSSR